MNDASAGRFPWQPPTTARAAMSALTPDDYGRFAEVIEWFLRVRGGESATTASSAPVHRWIRSLKKVAKGEATEDAPHTSGLRSGRITGSTVGALVDLYTSCAAAHAIQALEGLAATGQIQFSVDQSFVSRELCACDDTTRDVAAMPAGVGTLLAAADCAREIGGRVRVFGNRSKGLDVEWRHLDGSCVRMEAKARAFSRAFAPGATERQFVAWAASQVRQASTDLTARCVEDAMDDAVRVVRLTAFLPATLAHAVHGQQFLAALGKELSNVSAEHVPHAVICHWFGIDAEPTTEGFVSVADSLPHTVDISWALPARPSSVDAFYRLTSWPAEQARRISTAR